MHPEHLFDLGTLFVSLEKVFVFPRYDHFSKIQRYKAQIRPFKIFAEYYFSFILIFYFLFLVVTLLDLRMLFALHPVRSQQIRNRSEMVHFSSKLTEI